VIAELVDKSGNESFILCSVLSSKGQVVAGHIIASSTDEEERPGEEVSRSFLTNLLGENMDDAFKIRNLGREGYSCTLNAATETSRLQQC